VDLAGSLVQSKNSSLSLSLSLSLFHSLSLSFSGSILSTPSDVGRGPIPHTCAKVEQTAVEKGRSRHNSAENRDVCKLNLGFADKMLCIFAVSCTCMFVKLTVR
jgi:hypothetical protein